MSHRTEERRVGTRPKKSDGNAVAQDDGTMGRNTTKEPVPQCKDRILTEWKELEDRVIAEAKCIPDDKEELQEEWRMWCERWANIMRALSDCTDRGRTQNVVLTMSGEARAAGLGANEQYEQWTRECSALEAHTKDRESREVQMGIDSPPRARTGSTPAQPPSTDGTGGSASLAPRINRMKMEVAIPSKVRTSGPVMGATWFIRSIGLKGKVSDAPTLSASASGSLRRTVSSPGLAVPSGSEPEIVEAPVKRATRNTRKAAEPKGKGKGKAKEVVPATPTVEESSDEVSHYEKGKIAKVQHELHILKGQLISLYESAYKISTELADPLPSRIYNVFEYPSLYFVQCMHFLGVPSGFRMGSAWVPHGFHMGSAWVLHGIRPGIHPGSVRVPIQILTDAMG
ncbi:uncharacterized protein EDB91DRAFT_1090103 [Suillus paluster]|uniref:uncharacterized protein n=1 Tax=Suillus paluster TaxID=48578 RepID=UPI001B88277D|nr:uncharacterized protein EDB91DRAFT_1090103 [Suillus paluster]KAG1718343.1 hypothetical protein EDB91DRAFT_1090103 [Suillus paluster]